MKNLLDRIIKNFEQQYKIYTGMLNMSEKQLQYLQDQQNLSSSDEFIHLLQERQAVLQEVTLLSEENKRMQSQIIDEMGLDVFVLKHLKDKLNEQDFLCLQTVISNLGSLLEQMNRIDELSHQIMTEGLKDRIKSTPIKNTAKADRAYRQSMDNIKKPR